MIAPLPLAAALIAGASTAGPDADRITELYNVAGMVCLHRQVDCQPQDALVITDVRCTSEAGGEDLVRCNFSRRYRLQRWPDKCSGVFQADSGGRWFFRPSPNPEERAPGMPFVVPLCSAEGAPNSAQIAAARAAVWPQVECVPHSSEQNCPGPASRVQVVNCKLTGTDHRAFCVYTLLEDARGYFCQAYFTRIQDVWSLESREEHDGVLTYYESCRHFPSQGEDQVLLPD